MKCRMQRYTLSQTFFSIYYFSRYGAENLEHTYMHMCLFQIYGPFFFIAIGSNFLQTSFKLLPISKISALTGHQWYDSGDVIRPALLLWLP